VQEFQNIEENRKVSLGCLIFMQCEAAAGVAPGAQPQSGARSVAHGVSRGKGSRNVEEPQSGETITRFAMIILRRLMLRRYAAAGRERSFTHGLCRGLQIYRRSAAVLGDSAPHRDAKNLTNPSTSMLKSPPIKQGARGPAHHQGLGGQKSFP